MPSRCVAAILVSLMLLVPAQGRGDDPVKAPCAGDCDANGLLSVGEIVLSIRIALGELELAACSAADVNRDGTITIDENLSSVQNALLGCACPIDFARDNSASGSPACVFAGRWNSLCGDGTLEASFVGDGDYVIASVRQQDPVFFGAEAVSPAAAILRGWFTQEDLSDFEPLSGSLTLGDRGRTLVIEPDSPPLDIDGCAFVRYEGNFVLMIGH